MRMASGFINFTEHARLLTLQGLLFCPILLLILTNVCMLKKNTNCFVYIFFPPTTMIIYINQWGEFIQLFHHQEKGEGWCSFMH